MEDKMKKLETNVNQEEKEMKKKISKKSMFIIGTGILSLVFAGGAYIIKKFADKKQVEDDEFYDDYDSEIENMEIKDLDEEVSENDSDNSDN